MCSVGASDFRRSRTRAKARVAACVTGSRQSPDCRRPLPPRRPRAFARPFRFFPEIVRASRRALGRRSGRLDPAPTDSAGHRGARGGRLRCGCGAMLSSRAAPHPHPPRRAPRRRSPPSQLSSPAPPPSHSGPHALKQCSLRSENILRTKSHPPDRGGMCLPSPTALSCCPIVLLSYFVLESQKSDLLALILECINDHLVRGEVPGLLLDRKIPVVHPAIAATVPIFIAAD